MAWVPRAVRLPVLALADKQPVAPCVGMAPVNCDHARSLSALRISHAQRRRAVDAGDVDGLRAAGFTPAVMAPAEGPLADELAARGVELLPFQCRAADGTRLPQSRLREQLAEVLRRRRPALLHANSLAMGRLSGPVAAELQLPSIAHLRDIIKLSARAVADLNCHARLLAVSQAARAFTWPAESPPKKPTYSTTASISTSSVPGRRRATFTANSDFRPTHN